jgi:putative ABC transport system permease protein
MWTQDLRCAGRGLMKQAGFTATTVLILSLSIGATSAVFSALYHTLLHPLPFESAGRLRYVWLHAPSGGFETTPTPAHVAAWRERSRSFDFISQYSGGEYTLQDGDEPEILAAGEIEPDLPSLLGVKPIAGRTFTVDEAQVNGPGAVILSEGLWRRRFGARPGVINESLRLGDDIYSIVGVLPNDFGAFQRAGRESQLWLPLARRGERPRVNVLARLREGVSEARAAAELEVISKEVNAAGVSGNAWVPRLMGARDLVNDVTERGLPIVFAGVGTVLLIACANIGGLLLVRASARRHELALRSALGATRGSIARLLGAEAAWLALGGGAGGLLLGSWLIDLVRAVRPEQLNSLDTMQMDSAMLLFTAGLIAVTAALFGIAPSIISSRSNLLQPLQTGGRGPARASVRSRARSALVMMQIALSLVLLVASLLLVRSVMNLQNKDVGFRPDGISVFRLRLPVTAYPTRATRQAFYEQLMPLLGDIPAVEAVASATGVPAQFGISFGELETPEGVPSAAKTNVVRYANVSAAYPAMLGLVLRQGRFFRRDEAANSILINESLARGLWPGGAVGRRLRMDAAEEWKEVVGVIADVSVAGPKYSGSSPLVMAPADYSSTELMILLRVSSPVPASLIRQTVASIDPRLIPRDFTTMKALLSDSFALDRFFMMLLSSLAGLALLLSAMGLFGVISYAAGRRRPEIGIRMALGATPGSVQRMMLSDGVRLTVSGLAIGLPLSAVAVRLLEGSLSGVQPWDTASFTAALTVVAVTSLAAAFLPVRRAAKVDPVATLRAQ